MDDKYIGQHTDKSGADGDNGQRHKHSEGTEVGQSWGGGTQIITPDKSADLGDEYYVPGVNEETGEKDRDSD